MRFFVIAQLFAVTVCARNLPKPRIPVDNPMTPDKIRLGRLLFYDKRMSVNGATCHRQELAFTDGRGCGVGATGQMHPRGAMSLVNVAFDSSFNWADTTVHSLEEQGLRPTFSTTPLELGVQKDALLRLIQTDDEYRPLFRRAFPNESDPYTVANVAKSIATFERTIVSARSPYDRFHLDGDENAISESAKRGEILFFLDRGPACFRCHGGFNFSDSAEFHNTGLYNLAGQFSYPIPNRGLHEHTKRRDLLRVSDTTIRRKINLFADSS